MRKSITFALLASMTATLVAAKPPPKGGGASPPPANPAVAYRALSRNAVKLMVANEDSTNATALFTSPRGFAYDLAPRSQRQIVIAHGRGSDARLSLLSYTATASGTFETSSIVDLTPAREGSAVDFSPDGTKVAYACCVDSENENEKLAVYDLSTGEITHWATGTYYWDFAWFRNGASIAYSTLLPTELYEVTAPSATPQLLYSGQGEINVDSARADPDTLIASYNDQTGNARIGLWRGGDFTDPDLANSTRSWQGTLNCSDDKMAFMGVQNNSGSQAFYILDLNTRLTSLFSKSANIMLQFWPTCT